MKKIFDVSLWKEGFRQLRIIGIMCMIITVAYAVLFPMGMQQTYNRVDEAYRMGAIETTAYLLAPAFLMVPLMVLYLFRFLTSRDASDFYHGVPHTRTCLFVSFAGSVAAWFALVMAAYMAVSFFLIGVFPNIELSWTDMGLVLFTYVAAAILMLGVSLLAVSLTGTSLTNLAVLVMIIALPRLVLTISYYLIVNQVDFVIYREVPGLLNPMLNLFIGAGMTVLGNAGFFDWSNVVYSTALGIFYFAAGGYLFVKRKSEMAGQTAINPWLSLVFRLLPAFMVCLFPLYIILDGVSYGRRVLHVVGENWFGLLVFYVIAILVYLLYELITTRKLSAMFKSIPGLVVLAVMNIVYAVVFLVATNQMCNYSPEAEEVDSIRLITNLDAYDTDYFDVILSTVEFKNEEIQKVLCDGLEDTKNLWKQDRSEYRQRIWGNKSQNYEKVEVAFREGSVVRNRQVILTKNEYEKLNELIDNDPAYHKAQTEFPEWKEIGDFEIQMYGHYEDQLRGEEMQLLYEAFKHDISNLEFSEIRSILQAHASLKVEYRWNIGYTTGRITIPVVPELPTFFKTFMEYYTQYETNPVWEATIDYLGRMDEMKECDLSIGIVLYHNGVATGGTDSYVYSPEIYEGVDEEAERDEYGVSDWNREEFVALLKELPEEKESGEYLLGIRCDFHDWSDGEYFHVEHDNLRQISQESYEEMMGYMVWGIEEWMNPAEDTKVD